MLPGRMRGDVPPPVYGTGTDDAGDIPFSRISGLHRTGASSADIDRYDSILCSEYGAP